MRIPRIFSPQALSENAHVELDDRAANYCVNVLRMKKDFTVRLFNGQGGEYEGILTQISRRSVQVQLSRYDDVDRESNLAIHLALAISRGDRMDTAVQKVVELGVTAITPLMTERSIVRIDDSNREKRMTHWHGVVTSACEQSGRTAIPILTAPCSLADWLEDTDNMTRVAFLPDTENQLNSLQPPEHNVGILIGPEGGFSEPEVSAIRSSDVSMARLGPRILRTETAAISAVALVQAMWGDL